MKIDQREIEAQLGQRAARLFDGRGFGHLGPERAQMSGDPATKQGIVLEQEDLTPRGKLDVDSHEAHDASEAGAVFNTIRRYRVAGFAAGLAGYNQTTKLPGARTVAHSQFPDFPEGDPGHGEDVRLFP